MAERLLHTPRADQLIAWWRALSGVTQEQLVAQHVCGHVIHTNIKRPCGWLSEQQGWVPCAQGYYTKSPAGTADLRRQMARRGYISEDHLATPHRYHISFISDRRQYSLAGSTARTHECANLVALVALAAVLDEKGVLDEWLSRPRESEV